MLSIAAIKLALSLGLIALAGGASATGDVINTMTQSE